MASEPAKPKGSMLRRIGVGALSIVVLIGVVTGCMLSRPLWDVEHYKWKSGPSADVPELSIVAYNSNMGIGRDKFDPKLRITCEGGHPNLELTPVVTMMCVGDCSKGGTVQFDETFRTKLNASGSIFMATAGDRAHYDQDTLSNPPSALDSKAPPSTVGVEQAGAWQVAAKSTRAVRFDYDEYAKDDGVVYQQARNYIERMAASKELELMSGGYADFDTRDLKSSLPRFWAACPAPNAK